MKIIGLDLSINSTGICVHNEKEDLYYVIAPHLTKKQNECKNKYIHFVEYNKTNNINENLTSISHVIMGIITQHQPTIVIIEDVAMGATFSRSLIDLTGLNYWIRAFLTLYHVPFITVPPTKWKKELLGNGQATKELTIDAWKRLDPHIRNIEGIKCDDCADAYFLSRFTIS